jgi:hypothetical protein
MQRTRNMPAPDLSRFPLKNCRSGRFAAVAATAAAGRCTRWCRAFIKGSGQLCWLHVVGSSPPRLVVEPNGGAQWKDSLGGLFIAALRCSGTRRAAPCDRRISMKTRLHQLYQLNRCNVLGVSNASISSDSLNIAENGACGFRKWEVGSRK